MARDATQRMLDGSSWSDFCHQLERAGEVVLRESSPMDPFDRAEGWRYLTRLTRVALESFLEFADPRAPVFRRPSHETVKIGADNPDNYYESAAISGDFEYTIHGERGTVPYLGFGTYTGDYGSDGKRGQSGYLDASDLHTDADGRFQITLSVKPQPGNWLRMAPDTSSLIVRQTFSDRAQEKIATLRIERSDARAIPQPLTAEFLDQGLENAARYVQGTASLFADWAAEFRTRPNQLAKLDPAVASAAHGDPNICYFHGYWELGQDEALVVEVTPPECDYWNFQLNNHWMESLDYRYHRIALNHHTAQYHEDGSVRCLVAHRDPGSANWLETAGHSRGTMCLRWIGADRHPEPRVSVVKLSEWKEPA